MPGVAGDIAERLRSREGLVTVTATLGLALIVWRFGKPWFAAVLLTGILVTLEAVAGRSAVYLLLRGLVFLVLSAAVFWAIERSRNLLFSLGLAVAAVSILLFLVW